jgi:hypothetical protein
LRSPDPRGTTMANCDVWIGNAKL